MSLCVVELSLHLTGSSLFFTLPRSELTGAELQAAAPLFRVLLTLCDIFTHAAVAGHIPTSSECQCVFWEDLFPAGG